MKLRKHTNNKGAQQIRTGSHKKRLEKLGYLIKPCKHVWTVKRIVTGFNAEGRLENYKWYQCVNCQAKFKKIIK